MRAEYARTFRDPNTLHAICEEYRASNVQSSRCGANRALPAWYDVLAVWRQWADDVSGRGLDCGHFLPVEAPEETWSELRAFFTASTSQQSVD